MKKQYKNFHAAVLNTMIDHRWFYEAMVALRKDMQDDDSLSASISELINRIAKATGVVITIEHGSSYVEITEPHEDSPLDMTGLIAPVPWPFPKWPDQRAKDALYPEVPLSEIYDALGGGPFLWSDFVHVIGKLSELGYKVVHK